MYLTLTCKGIDLKNKEIFLKNSSRIKGNEWKNEIQIQRVIIDWSTKTVYETYEWTNEGEAPIHEDNDYVELGVRQVYGPYGTEASVKTARSKIEKKLREKSTTS